jgi:DNA (cytosine-5)-methyltransferase 1
MKAGSLFSGVGGFDLGFERAGINTVWQVEKDKYARAVLAQHFPNAEQHEDVRYVGAGNLSAIDVITGGFPCQDVSIAGNRAGLDGERSGLWHEFHRILAELKPSWVVVENVPGLLSSNGGRDFAVVLRGLVECGYGGCWRVLDSQYFGVPQRRRRVFIVGHLGTGRAAEILFERESLRGDSTASRASREDVAGTLASGAHPSGFNGQSAYTNHTVTSTLAASGAGSARPAGQANEADMLVYRNRAYGDYVASESASTRKARDNKQSADDQVISGTAIDVRNLRSNGQISGTLQAKATGGYSLNYTNPVAVNLQASRTASNPVRREGMTGTLGTTRIEGVFHNAGVRRLTPTECERLQGFPDGWTAQHSDSQRYRQMGNAVTVNVAQWIAQRIIANEQANAQQEAA